MPHADEQFMQMAIQEAKKAYMEGEIPVGAVAVHRGRVIGRGHNCKESQRNPVAHAEILALQEAAAARGGWRLLDVTLYCTMEPCPMCAGAILQARLLRLVYAVDDPKAGAAGSVIDLLNHPHLNHQVQVTRHVLEAEVRDLLSSFFRDLRTGRVPRYSAERQQRRLAEKADPL